MFDQDTAFTESGFLFGAGNSHKKLTELDAKVRDLYHAAEDFWETCNVAAANREMLIETIAMWDVEAGKGNVLPVYGGGQLCIEGKLVGRGKDLSLPRFSRVLLAPLPAVPILGSRSHRPISRRLSLPESSTMLS